MGRMKVNGHETSNTGGLTIAGGDMVSPATSLERAAAEAAMSLGGGTWLDNETVEVELRNGTRVRADESSGLLDNFRTIDRL